MKAKRPRGRPPHADVLTPSEWRTVEDPDGRPLAVMSQVRGRLPAT